MPIALVLAVLILATVLFISNRLRADLVALIVLVTLGASGLITQSDAFSGFSSSSVITILAAFVITGAINQTGSGNISALFYYVWQTTARAVSSWC